MSSARSKAALQDGVAVKQEPPDDGDDDSEEEDDGWEYGDGGGGNMAAAEELDVDEDFDDAATEEAQRKRALQEEERAAKRAKLESNPAEMAKYRTLAAQQEAQKLLQQQELIIPSIIKLCRALQMQEPQLQLVMKRLSGGDGAPAQTPQEQVKYFLTLRQVQIDRLKQVDAQRLEQQRQQALQQQQHEWMRQEQERRQQKAMEKAQMAEDSVLDVSSSARQQQRTTAAALTSPLTPLATHTTHPTHHSYHSHHSPLPAHTGEYEQRRRAGGQRAARAARDGDIRAGRRLPQRRRGSAR